MSKELEETTITIKTINGEQILPVEKYADWLRDQEWTPDGSHLKDEDTVIIVETRRNCSSDSQ